MVRKGLADLPNEVLSQVLSHITDQSHLAKILLVSKHFKDLIELHSYRHISLDIRCSAKDLRSADLSKRHSYTTPPSFVRFDRLINKLSMRQNLATQVHTLSLKVQRQLWDTRFNANSGLLVLLPRLKTLSLSPPPCHLVVPHKNSILTSLRLDFSQVTDYSDEEGHGLHIPITQLQVIAGHLSLPSLRKFQVEKTLLMPYWDDNIHLPPASSSVDDLRLLEYCKEHDACIVAIFLLSIKGLTRFVFEMSPHFAESGVSTGSLRRALSRHGETIEELAVVISQGSSMMVWTLGPFKQWSSLKFLAIPGYMIQRTISGTQQMHELLPPLLEELQIQCSTVHDDWTTPALYRRERATARGQDVANMQHLANNASCFPRLNRVIWWHKGPMYFASAWVEIALAFEEVGIQFEWVAEVYFKNTPFGKWLREWQE